MRLTAAFPLPSRFADLGDFLRRMRLESRALLFLAIAALGAAVALGTRTPYYRFLIDSVGPIFRAIRAPSRGIVLFDLGLAVLAAWGLSRLPSRRLSIAAAIVLTAWEYRVFPVRIDPVESQPPAVDRWLSGVEVEGSVVEWPFATEEEVEFQFRSTAHWKPLVNGYSGFFPPAYYELSTFFEKKALARRKAISSEVWEALEKRDCRLLVLHPHLIPEEPVRRAYLATLQDALREKRIRALQSFPHGKSIDIAFAVRRKDSTPEPPTESEASREGQRSLEMLTKALNPPFGVIDSPKPDEVVAQGVSGFGWALDDSGVEHVLLSVDGGPPVRLPYGLPHPGPPRVYPEYPDAAHAGFAFTIPRLPAGTHVLKLTIEAKDGGTDTVTRRFRVR